MAPKPENAKNMKDLYIQELGSLEVNLQKLMPIVEMDNSTEEAYKYIIFPKVLHSYIQEQDSNNKITWSKNKMVGNKFSVSSIEKPKVSYSPVNIKEVIWITLWIASYWWAENLILGIITTTR
jgi:hypothetical protein